MQLCFLITDTLSHDNIIEGGQALSRLTEQVLRMYQLVCRDTKTGFLGP